MRNRVALLAVLFLIIVVAVVVVLQQSGRQTLTVTDARARSTASVVSTGVVYFDLRSVSDDALTGVVVPADIAGTATLHEEMAGANDTMSMSAIAAVPLPAGQTVRLEPGRTHVMMENLRAPLTAGQSFTLQLQFEHHAPYDVRVRVADRV